MKKSILTSVLFLLTILCVSQVKVKTIKFHIDTLQLMSWKKGFNFKSAKDSNEIVYETVYKTDCDIVVNLDTKSIVAFYSPDKRISYTGKILNFSQTKTSYFFEYSIEGYTENEKTLVCENEDGTFSAITEYIKNDNSSPGGGYFDRNVKLTVK